MDKSQKEVQPSAIDNQNIVSSSHPIKRHHAHLYLIITFGVMLLISLAVFSKAKFKQNVHSTTQTSAIHTPSPTIQTESNPVTYVSQSADNTIDPTSVQVQSLKTIKNSGGRVDWSAPNQPVVFDRQVSANHYEIFTTNPDGSGERCVTCDNTSIPHVNNGNPAWLPDGKWITFQSVKSGLSSSVINTPGLGVYSDLWVITKDGKTAVKLVSTNRSSGSGILHPHFSPDGTKISWTQMSQPANPLSKNQEYGYWQLKVADFTDKPSPMIYHINTYTPGGDAFYENHGISPDNKWIYFTSNMRAKEQHKSLFHDNDIYRMNLANGYLQQLTTEGYNEHAELSPDGKLLVWMSSSGIKGGGTDYWLMNADGSEKKRLTYYNSKGSPEYTGGMIVCADSAWSPDGKKILGFVLKDLFKQTGKLDLISLSHK